MTLKVLFLASFVAGLGLAVYSMLHGVERSRSGTVRRPSSVFNAPTASAFAIVLGATGYLLVTRSTWSMMAILAAGITFACAATTGMIALMSQWALAYRVDDGGDEQIQGQLALVTRLISASTPGEIVFHANGVRRTLAAESIQGSEIAVETEVVIDTVKDGVARVELWSIVEQRL